MSKALSRVRALISEIDSIQTQGRGSYSALSSMKANLEELPPVTTQKVEFNNVLPLNAPTADPAPVQAITPEGKVFIQLTGKIAVQLKLEHTEETVEVRQIGETIEIRFTDGKAIHLPLKNVA